MILLDTSAWIEIFRKSKEGAIILDIVEKCINDNKNIFTSIQ